MLSSYGEEYFLKVFWCVMVSCCRILLCVTHCAFLSLTVSVHLSVSDFFFFFFFLRGGGGLSIFLYLSIFLSLSPPPLLTLKK